MLKSTGILTEYIAINKVKAGFTMVFMPWVQIATNTLWINYIWYNQKMFLNYTIDALEAWESS